MQPPRITARSQLQVRLGGLELWKQSPSPSSPLFHLTQNLFLGLLLVCQLLTLLHTPRATNTVTCCASPYSSASSAGAQASRRQLHVEVQDYYWNMWGATPARLKTLLVSKTFQQPLLSKVWENSRRYKDGNKLQTAAHLRHGQVKL